MEKKVLLFLEEHATELAEKNIGEIEYVFQTDDGESIEYNEVAINDAQIKDVMSASDNHDLVTGTCLLELKTEAVEDYSDDYSGEATRTGLEKIDKIKVTYTIDTSGSEWGLT